MKTYHVDGGIEYLLFCPKAPELETLDQHPIASECDGHTYYATVNCYVDAPDSDRAAWKALDKVKSAYPWPCWAAAPAITQVWPRFPDPPGAVPLPGMEDTLRPGSVVLTYGDRRVVVD